MYSNPVGSNTLSVTSEITLERQNWKHRSQELVHRTLLIWSKHKAHHWMKNILADCLSRLVTKNLTDWKLQAQRTWIWMHTVWRPTPPNPITKTTDTNFINVTGTGIHHIKSLQQNTYWKCIYDTLHVPSIIDSPLKITHYSRQYQMEINPLILWHLSKSQILSLNDLS